MSHSLRVALVTGLALVIAVVAEWLFDNPLSFAAIPVVESVPISSLVFIVAFDVLAFAGTVKRK